MGFLDDIPDLGLPKAEQPKEADAKRVCVEWIRPRCPYCGSANVPVTNSNHKPYRYHKCADCKRNFPSLELNYRD